MSSQVLCLGASRWMMKWVGNPPGYPGPRPSPARHQADDTQAMSRPLLAQVNNPSLRWRHAISQVWIYSRENGKPLSWNCIHIHIPHRGVSYGTTHKGKRNTTCTQIMDANGMGETGRRAGKVDG